MQLSRKFWLMLKNYNNLANNRAQMRLKLNLKSPGFMKMTLYFKLIQFLSLLFKLKKLQNAHLMERGTLKIVKIKFVKFVRFRKLDYRYRELKEAIENDLI